MRITRFSLVFLLFSGHGFSFAEQADSLRDLFRSLSEYSATDKAPDIDQIRPLISKGVPRATANELRELVPLVRKCLASTNAVVRNDAMSFLFGLATSRTDSAQLMEPYEDSLMVLLDQDSREPAIYLLGIEHPRPSPRALTALYAHLNDGKNSPEEFDLIAGALLSSFPADPSVAHEVLAAARKRMKVGVDDSIIRNIGLAKITNAEALAYVREGFSDPGVRIAAVEAIGRMPSEIRARFVNELRSVAEDSGERPETRAEAQQVLKEP